MAFAGDLVLVAVEAGITVVAWIVAIGIIGRTVR
jgi:hypothetical protein